MFSGEIFRTATFRLVLTLTLAFSALIGLLFGFIYWQTTVYETHRIDTILTNEASNLADAPESVVLRQVSLRISADLHRISFAGLFAPDGTRIAGNLRKPPASLPADGAVHGVSASRLDPENSDTESARASPAP